MIPINDLSSRLSANSKLLQAAFAQVLASGSLVLGPEVKRFEASFANYLGTRCCVTVANGTDAIELALRAVGIKAGHSVATVANAGMYTSTAVLAIGAEAFFIDVDLQSRNTTLAEVERALDAGVHAVVVTHLYGLAVPQIVEIAALCKHRRVPLIEDCAQAHGALINAKRVGSFGDAAAFSFYPTKNLGALGDGGAVATNDEGLAEKVKRLRQYGWTSKYHVEVAGGRNSRLDEVQAALLSTLLPQLDDDNAQRRAIAERYKKGLVHADLELPQYTGAEYVAHLYVVRTPHREALRAQLQANKVATDVHYPIPDYRQPVFAGRCEHVRLANTEILAQQVLTLPCYPNMRESDVDTVISVVNAARA